MVYGESIITPISVLPTTGIRSLTSSVAASRSNTNSNPRVLGVVVPDRQPVLEVGERFTGPRRFEGDSYTRFVVVVGGGDRLRVG